MSRSSPSNCSVLRAKLWAIHELAELEMLAVAREKPRRPWYRKRAARVIKAYEETLAAVPLPPDEPNAKAEALSLSEVDPPAAG